MMKEERTHMVPLPSVPMTSPHAGPRSAAVSIPDLFPGFGSVPQVPQRLQLPRPLLCGLKYKNCHGKWES